MSGSLTEGNATDFFSGSASALNADVISSKDINDFQASYLQVTGTFSATLKVQGSNDNANFQDVLVTDVSNPSQSPLTTISAPGLFYIPTPFRYFRLRITAYTSGTASGLVYFQRDISGDLGPRTVNAIQSGTWSVQAVQSGSWSVGRTWTLASGTDSVSAVQSGTWTVVANEDKNYGAVEANTLRTASQIGNATGAADFNAGATGAQTLRATANQGSPGTAANAWFDKITDGTNTAAVKAASTAAVATDPSLVVALSPNSPLPAGTNVLGGVTQSGTWTVQQGTPPWSVAGNAASGASDSGNPVKVGAIFNTTQPTVTNTQRVDLQATSRGSLIVATGVDPLDIRNVTGTVSLPTGAATSANQSTEITSLQILDDVPTAQNGALVKGTPIMGQLDDTSTTAATEDNVAAVRITAQRAVHTNLRNNAGTEVGTTAAPVKMQASDGTDLQLVTANGDAKVIDGLRNGGVYGALSIPTANTPVEAKVGASRLTNRKFLQIYSNNNGLFWGLDNTVTTTSGTPIVNGQVLTFAIDPDSTFQIWLVGSSNGKSVQVTECP